MPAAANAANDANDASTVPVAPRQASPAANGTFNAPAGVVGKLVQRLAPGQGMMLSATGTATVPAALLSEFFPPAFFTPDLGATLRMAGMLSRKPDGKLLLTLTFQSGESASYSRSWGSFSAGVTIGDRRYGLKLGAEATAGAELSQSGVVTLKFDPARPDDMRRLHDLLTPALPFTRPKIQGGGALRQALTHNRQNASWGGGFGANAGVVGAATLGPAANDSGSSAAADANDAPWRIKAKLGVTGAVAGEAYRTYGRDGAVTDTVALEGGAEGSLKLPGAARGKLAARTAASFSATHDAQGALSGLAASFTETRNARAFLDVTAVDPGAKTAAKRVITRELTPAALAQARTLVAAGRSPLEAYRTLAADPANVDEQAVEVRSDSLLAGADASVALGAHALKLSWLLAATRVDRRATDDRDPGLSELLSTLRGGPEGARR